MLSFTQTESDKTNTLGIFASFILSVKGKSTKLGMLQAFLQTDWPFLYYRQIICPVKLCQLNFCLSDHSSDKFSRIKMGNSWIIHLICPVKLCQLNFCLSDHSSDKFSRIKMGNSWIIHLHT